MRQKRLMVIGEPISFATPARYFSTVVLAVIGIVAYKVVRAVLRMM